MKATTHRDRLLESLGTLGAWADLVCDKDSPQEVVRIVVALGFLAGLLVAQDQPQLASALLASASEEIPDALDMAQELAQGVAKE